MQLFPRHGRWLTLLSLATAALTLLLLSGTGRPAAASDPGFTLMNGNVRTGSQSLFLDTRFSANLTRDARDALDGGVPLTLELQVRIIRPRRWWWDAEVVELTQNQELRYHALSRRFVVHNRNTGERRTYFRRDVALAAWTTMDNVFLINRRNLDPGERYEVQARVRLNLDALPHPLRTVAFVSPDWRLVSEWIIWPIEG